MQECANGVVIPSGYAHITKKICDGFSFMKVDEWKSWYIIYSPFVLKHVIPAIHLANWMLFVKACCLLTRPSITVEETTEAHKQLQEFCTKCQTLYKKPVVTPNMHLHLHLSEYINDFDPVYAFWLFSFEHYNGLLKNFETNQKGGFESTMMKQFLEKAYIGSYIRAFSTSLDEFIITFLHNISNSQPHLPLQSDSSAFNLPQFVEFSSNPCKLFSGWEPLPPATFPIKLEKMIIIHNVFAHYSDHHSSQIFMNNQIEKIKRISLLGQEYSSGSYFQAFFLEHKGKDISAFPGRILYLFQHILNINSKDVVHTFAFVE
ncbi:hypothetical protein PHYBLDRAFT_70220 [Phycomyces blakesleeanus NRRL 1555(-)]|uniref:Uncharacterized protein n=1 Tax=Phycomyces blakesleeanus (strain ATCC 8743b / DSM 1359 / FGSC 10004 / NBRC 33097 / NRRL 1555) TaxID=763407 RepID=A0A167JVX4_PHYB8|nr:hypothetical protein PHYBLDRAFT_70220 [Phycomyces blakesleeanus NRRL 1555(-)]OAD66790.1 hypothetical protein PHYBLDRAFT_70220 [Phycomyces blakesleeanus NRRL 1555(-)]|eukprot:XP_018284830.1 hypothetical protein PHYBLDRAFT_70220 [Phycomyces blakesleeanus NRRL 1555(-)]